MCIVYDHTYRPDEKRYANMIYRRCGNSGLKLPVISLGLWQNFGSNDSYANMVDMIHTAFDLGIVHFDLANNYGHPYNGTAEKNFGKILCDMKPYRDEMCISTKAGYEMWDGPYGNRNGSRKYLISSLDQSLNRLGLEYVDIFYHHCPDDETPIEETALALDHVVKQGKALYVGISNYNSQQTRAILEIFHKLHTPFVVNQPSYSMLNRWIETDGLDSLAQEKGFGLAVFSPLAQGFLTGRYLHGIPADSRVGKGNAWLRSQLDETMLKRLNQLDQIAAERGQSLSQMALSWVLHHKAVTTVITGASRKEQILDNAACIAKLDFTNEEIAAIEAVLNL